MTLALLQNSGGGSGIVMLLFQLIIAALAIAGFWKIFTKAGQPGWAAIVPIYNIYIITKIVGRPVLWVILALIPFVNIIIAIILFIDLAKTFGKGAGYGIGLALLPFIFAPMLGFGSDDYQGATAAA